MADMKIVNGRIYEVGDHEVTGTIISQLVAEHFNSHFTNQTSVKGMFAQGATIESHHHSIRRILVSQQRGASREIEDLRIVLAMLPAEPTREQEQAFTRLFLNQTRRTL